MKDMINIENNEKGATMIEYALMVALMAILLMAAITLMKNNTSTAFSQVGSAITTN